MAKEYLDKLEPEARKASSHREERAGVSAAISLKRIADRLDGITAHLRLISKSLGKIAEVKKKGL